MERGMFGLASCSHDCAMHALFRTLIGQDNRSNDIGPDCLKLVFFAPVDVRAASFACAVDDMGRLDLVEDLLHFGLVLHTHGCDVNIFSLGEEEVLEVAAYPSGNAAPDEEAVRRSRFIPDRLVFKLCWL